MSSKRKSLPWGTQSDAAKRLGIPRQYVGQVISGMCSGSERCLEILKVVEECADVRFQKRLEEQKLRNNLNNKYSAAR